LANMAWWSGGLCSAIKKIVILLHEYKALRNVKTGAGFIFRGRDRGIL